MTPQAARHAAAPMQQFGLLAATIRLSYLSLARYQTVAAGPVGLQARATGFASWRCTN